MTQTFEINGLESIRKAIEKCTKKSTDVKATLFEAVNENVKIPSEVTPEELSVIPDDAITESEVYSDSISSYDYQQQYDFLQNNDMYYGHGYPQPLQDYGNGYMDDILSKDTQKKKSYPCPDCGKIFSRSDHMRRHQRSIHMAYSPFQCDLCPRSYARADKLKLHRKNHEVGPANLYNYSCHLCTQWFASDNDLLCHIKTHQQTRPPVESLVHVDFIKGEFS